MRRFILVCASAFAISAACLPAQSRVTAAPGAMYCALDRSLGPRRSLVVDLRLRSGDANRTPTAADSAAVRNAGGQPVYAFRVAVLRAALDTSALRVLLSARGGIADVAYTVADTSRRDVRLQVFFSRPVTDADAAALARLGATDVRRMPNRRILSLTAPDSVVPRIDAAAGVTLVRAQAMECVIAGGDRGP